MKFTRRETTAEVEWRSDAGPSVFVTKPHNMFGGYPARIGCSAMCSLSSEDTLALTNALLEAAAEADRLNSTR
jgi:hypothetical protein